MAEDALVQVSTFGNHRIFADSPIRPFVLADLDRLMQESRRIRRTHDLEGRGLVTTGHIQGLGDVALKQYRRGGLLSLVNDSLYLGLCSSRLETEYRMLRIVNERGLPAPKPLCLIVRGKVFQSAWLLMEELRDMQTLSSMCRNVSSAAPRAEFAVHSLAIKHLAASVIGLIENLIWHVDLHPGNVLVSPTGEASIIDFDKAVFFRGRRNELRDRYITRWRRASIKHKLPEFLSEEFCAHVRRKFDGAI